MNKPDNQQDFDSANDIFWAMVRKTDASNTSASVDERTRRLQADRTSRLLALLCHHLRESGAIDRRTLNSLISEATAEDLSLIHI